MNKELTQQYTNLASQLGDVIFKLSILEARKAQITKDMFEVAKQAEVVAKHKQSTEETASADKNAPAEGV